MTSSSGTAIRVLIADDQELVRTGPVSYTHLTLPTILLV